MKQVYLPLLLLLFFNTLGQNNRNRFAFKEFSNIKITKDNSSIKNPWTGGINYANMNTMDLNGDGRMDLVVFDKTGPRVTTFVDKNSSRAADFIYTPEYRINFPIGKNIGFEEDWMLLRDFDCDGKKDLFVGISSYMKVYKNISIGNQIGFQKAHSGDYLQIQDDPISVKLYVLQTDVPGIIDIDNDGDLDIINFSGSRSSVEWMENQQNCGLNFKVKER